MLPMVYPDLHWQNTFATVACYQFHENGRKSMTNYLLVLRIFRNGYI